MKNSQKGFSLLLAVVAVAVLAFGGYYVYKKITPNTIGEMNAQDANVKQQYAQTLLSRISAGNTTESQCSSFSSKVMQPSLSDNSVLRDYFFDTSKNICFGLIVIGNTSNAKIVNLISGSTIVSCENTYNDTICSDEKNNWDWIKDNKKPIPDPIFYPDTSGRIGTWEALKSLGK